MKVKIVAILTIVILLLASVPVYAETTIPDPPYGAWQFWIVADSYGQTILFTSQDPIKVEVDQRNYIWLHLSCLKKYKLIDNQWVYEKETLNGIRTCIETVYASNHNIAYKDGSGFFFTPPKVSALYQAARQAKNRGDFGMILRTILAGLIPVLGCLILAISLRKGWAFLQSQLMH